jgi:HEPN domain
VAKLNIDQKIVNRLNELIERGEQVVKTGKSRSGRGVVYVGDWSVDSQLSHQWGMSCLSILERTFGDESNYYKNFNGLYSRFNDYTPVKNALGILRAAKDDYENGYLFEVRVLIEAEVFDDFLEQAKYLFDSGYHAPAAIIAGSVLEDGLRKLCIREGITLSSKPKLDAMNADLAKSGVYNVLIQKKITALADIRNKAAHGKWNEFAESDVEQMIVQVRSFMEDNFS